MGLRFQRRLTLFPGVRLNLSARGISTTIGVRGASVNLGPEGAYLNLGIPGSGLALRTRIAPKPSRPATAPVSPASFPPPEPGPLPISPSPIDPGPQPGEIRSGAVSALTSSGLDELKRLINEATVRRRSLESQVSARESDLSKAKQRLRHAERFLVRVFMQGKLPRLATEVVEAEAKLESAREELAACSIDVDFAFDSPTLDAYAALVRAFAGLRSCQRIWDITASVATNRIVERTIATSSVTRHPVRFDLRSSDVIEAKHQALWLENANGGDLYIYPGYVMMRSRGHDFALIEVRELEVSLELSSFIEEETVPGDSEQIGTTWKKANKDGSRDRRFANNYQIPIMRYGRLWFRSPTGLRECYLVSSYPKAEAFVVAFQAYQKALAASAERAKLAPPVEEEPAEPVESADTADSFAGAPDGSDRGAAISKAAGYRLPSLVADYATIVLLVIGLSGAAYWATKSRINAEPAAIAPVTSAPVIAASPPAAEPMPAMAVPARERVYVQKSGANVRAEPSTSATIVAREAQGTEFFVFARQGEWVEVGRETPVGWIHSSLVGSKAP